MRANVSNGVTDVCLSFRSLFNANLEILPAERSLTDFNAAAREIIVKITRKRNIFTEMLLKRFKGRFFLLDNCDAKIGDASKRFEMLLMI